MGWQLVGNIAGKSADASVIEELRAEVALLRTELAAAEETHEDGASKEVTAKLVRFAVESEFARITGDMEARIASLPISEKGQDGKSLTPDDVAPMIVSEVHKAVSSLPVPKDGSGLVGAFIDRDGHLLVTLSDGTTKDAGVVVGRDGAAVDMADVKRHIDAALEQWPRPKDGKDGLGFDDFEEVMEDGGRVVLHRYTSGERVKEFRHVTATMIHRGLYKAGQSYLRGDVVLWGNSSWTAVEDTKAEPGAAPAASRAWVLVARKGDVGKSGSIGKTGERGPQGPEGPQGRSGY